MRLRPAILALALVSVPAFGAEGADTTPAPKAVVEQAVHDFGQVPPAEVLHHEFIVRNDGNAPLEISRVVADCKCTAVEFDHTIAPGASGKVVAAVDTRELAGAVEGHLTVLTNDPASPSLQLKTTLEVRHIVLAYPGTARWNMVQGEKEGTLGDTVWATDGTDFHIVRVNAPSFLRTAVRPATGDELRPDVKGPQYRVELTLPTDAPVGALTGYVDVVTDHPKQPSVRIPISGFVRPTIFVSPASGDFGTVSLDKTKKAVFELRNFATEKIAITGTENTLKGTTLEVKPKEEGRSYTLEVTLPATLALGEHKGALRIRTDSPKVPLIVVPLSITIAKPAATAPPRSSR